jgi:F-type H+-transporting ATPase subunit delta
MTDNVGRKSYAEAAEALASATARATDLQRTTVADEILLVARLLRGEPRLRRALTDPSRPRADRVALLRTLLSGKVSETTVNVLSGLAAGRWSRPADLLDATERLGVDAVLSATQASGAIADVEDELFRFGQIVRRSADGLSWSRTC